MHLSKYLYFMLLATGLHLLKVSDLNYVRLRQQWVSEISQVILMKYQRSYKIAFHRGRRNFLNLAGISTISQFFTEGFM